MADDAGFQIILRGEEETLRLGRFVGSILCGGDCVALIGQLGAGKTTFVKGVAAALLVPAKEPVVSPTFVLVREYVGRLHMYHIDAYRLSGPDELTAIGLDEMFSDSNGVTLIEWAERVKGALPAAYWRISFEHVDAGKRLARIQAPDLERERVLPQFSGGRAP